jgi:hypothetical protein
MTIEKRKDKRFSIGNTLIQFHGKKPRWGRLMDISQNGLKVLSNMNFEEGEIVQAKFYTRSVPSRPVKQEYLILKMKIVWKHPNTEKKGMKNFYGASFVEVSDESMKQINFIIDKLSKVKKMSASEIEKLLSDVRLFLERMDKPN